MLGLDGWCQPYTRPSVVALLKRERWFAVAYNFRRLVGVAIAAWLATGVANAQVVHVELRVVTEASTFDETTELPGSLSEIYVESDFFVEVWVSNVGSDAPGITGGTVDMGFDASLAEATAIDYGLVLWELATGTIDNGQGLVDDLGSCTLVAGTAVAPMWTLLARVSFAAMDDGEAVFGVSPGAFRFALAGGLPSLDFDTDVAFGAAQIVAIIGSGDFDGDFDVDLDDYSELLHCITGPIDEPPPLPLGCERGDFDDNDVVDLRDFGSFQRIFTGARQ